MHWESILISMKIFVRRCTDHFFYFSLLLSDYCHISRWLFLAYLIIAYNAPREHLDLNGGFSYADAQVAFFLFFLRLITYFSCGPPNSEFMKGGPGWRCD
ncbi:hypothetical protein T492DRAFT_1002031 [Pavlovales sp. CCMP2436]|nr:hypothetical protein T492DRAFT_1002031 [Pavlovales sp. CCMP2436]